MENLPLFASKPRLFIHIRLKARSAYKRKQKMNVKKGVTHGQDLCMPTKVKKKQKEKLSY